MNWIKRSIFVRTLLFLFALNTVCIFLYFSLHPRPRPPLDEENLTITITPPSLPSSSLKPWPVLPSYLLWNITTFPPVGSCEAYFGNGFSRSISLHSGRTGFFRCHYSETLGSSICEGGTIRMDPGKIMMSRGGEDLKMVMGRREEDELPKYETGAFQIEEGEGWKRREDRRLVDQSFLDQYLKHGQVHMHTMRSLLESIRFVPTGELQCDQVRSIYLLHISKYLCLLFCYFFLNLYCRI
jgi:glycoprotein 2-beta-D-xylosyltransferase